jgi:hypothetical protein
LDKVRGGSTSPKVGQGRRKDKRNYPRPQAEAEDNVHHRVRQRGAGHEETAGRTHHCANTEKGASGSNGTASRAVAEVIAQAEEAKTHIAQTQAECAGLISDEIAVQIVDTLKEKTAQVQTQATELKEKFQAITKEIEEAHKG